MLLSKYYIMVDNRRSLHDKDLLRCKSVSRLIKALLGGKYRKSFLPLYVCLVQI